MSDTMKMSLSKRFNQEKNDIRKNYKKTEPIAKLFVNLRKQAERKKIDIFLMTIHYIRGLEDH